MLVSKHKKTKGLRSCANITELSVDRRFSYASMSGLPKKLCLGNQLENTRCIFLFCESLDLVVGKKSVA